MIYIKRNSIKLILRISISFCILAFLFSRINIHLIWNTLKNFNPLIYILSFGILLIHQALWTYAWKITLEEKNVKIKYFDAYRAVLTSYFFGTFLPSSIGPDLILTFNIGRSLPEKEHAPSSLLFIRIVHISGILFVSGIALLFLPNLFAIKNIRILTWVLMLSVWTSYWIAVHPFVRKTFDKLFAKYPKYLKIIYKIFHSFSEFGLDKTVLKRVWLIGLFMAFLKMLIDYLIARSLGVHIPYIYFLALIPSVSIIGLLPVSIAGLGVREGAYVTLFSIIGVPSAFSLSISLTVFTLNIVLCIIGAVLYLVHGSHVKSKINPPTFPQSIGTREKDLKTPFIPAAGPRSIREGGGIK